MCTCSYINERHRTFKLVNILSRIKLNPYLDVTCWCSLQKLHENRKYYQENNCSHRCHFFEEKVSHKLWKIGRLFAKTNSVGKAMNWNPAYAVVIYVIGEQPARASQAGTNRKEVLFKLSLFFSFHHFKINTQRNLVSVTVRVNQTKVF